MSRDIREVNARTQRVVSHEEIWQILSDECGATPHMPSDFKTLFPGCNEYRFMGGLGFGGKIWAPQGSCPIRVSCYPEDETPARKAMIKAANEKLAALR